MPRFESVAVAMDHLEGNLQTLCNQPSAAHLEQARQAWKQARSSWTRSQAMGFGPVMERRSRSLVDWFPVDPERIEETLANRESLSAEEVREFLSATQRGLGAIEYVLFQEDSRVLDNLQQPDALHCAYLTALGNVAAAETNGVLTAWTGTASETPYADVFTGSAASSLLDIAAVAELVRTSVFLLRTITDMQLGNALGLNGGEPDPKAIPGGAGHHAVDDMRNQVLGIQDIYLGIQTDGTEGTGLSALIHNLSPEVDNNLRVAFEEVLASLDNLEEPLHETVVSDAAPSLEVHAQLKSLQRIWNTDVVSLLGVSVGFADTDGDSG